MMRFLDLIQSERLRVDSESFSTIYYEGQNNRLNSLEEYFEALNQLAVKSIKKSNQICGRLLFPVKMSNVAVPNLGEFSIDECVIQTKEILPSLFEAKIFNPWLSKSTLAIVTVKVIERKE